MTQAESWHSTLVVNYVFNGFLSYTAIAFNIITIQYMFNIITIQALLSLASLSTSCFWFVIYQYSVFALLL